MLMPQSGSPSTGGTSKKGIIRNSYFKSEFRQVHWRPLAGAGERFCCANSCLFIFYNMSTFHGLCKIWSMRWYNMVHGTTKWGKAVDTSVVVVFS